MIEYYHTNESLDAIVESMELKSTDRVLAVCGSGEQAFAMLPHVKCIHAVDRNPEQVRYAKDRLASLEKGDINGFIQPDMMTKYSGAIEYFTKKRIEAIREKLCCLTFEDIDMKELFKRETAIYDKLYLSNIEMWGGEPRNAARILAPRGLVYFCVWPGPMDPELYASEPKLETNAERLESEWGNKGGLIWCPAIFRRKE